MFKTPRFRRVTAPCWALTLGLIILAAGPAHSQAPADFGQDGASPARVKTPLSSPPASPSDEPTKDGSIKSTTDLVTLTVTVTDRNQRLVTGLDQKNFEVYEDKVKQSIEFFNDVDAPLNVGIVFDVSGSMKGKIDRARNALKAFIQTSHNDDDFFLVGFNQRANLLAEFTDGDSLLNKLNLVDPNGQTALYDAAYLGIEKVQQGRHQKRAILLISDGQDNASRYSYGELRKLLKEANVQIYCIGIVELGGAAGSLLDVGGQSILEEISQTTGGKAFFPRSGPELEDATTRIALELRHQYSIGYVPQNEQRDGRWRRIKIRVNPPRGLPDLSVRAKEGYFAGPR
ncbi:MAG TPA: VWA domain-containing protein [Blastocatellia bacterium]|nr:VWA domain-containing protein [Blastocatellia bacterium]